MKKIISLSLFVMLAFSCVYASSGSVPTTGGNPVPTPTVNTGKTPTK